MSEITISSKDGKPMYRLAPKGSASTHTLCYELLFWRDAYTDDKGEDHEGLWKASGKYPSTIAAGMRCIAEDIERNGSWKFFAKANVKSLREMADEFEAILSGFHLKLEDESQA